MRSLKLTSSSNDWLFQAINTRRASLPLASDTAASAKLQPSHETESKNNRLIHDSLIKQFEDYAAQQKEKPS